MAKSKILKELANDEISLDVAFSRLMIIASDINDEELRKWALKELNGYGKDDECPSYRFIKSNKILYTGFNRNCQVTNMPLPLSCIPDECQKRLGNIMEDRSIASLLSIIKDKQTMGHDVTFLAPAIYEYSGGMIQCASIHVTFDYINFNGILSSIRTKLLDVFIELDKRLGNLDDLDVVTEDTDLLSELKQITYNIIYQDNSVKIGDNNKIDKSNILGGEFDGN
jgi:hypothetical protein